jgi:hypothetical protein
MPFEKGFDALDYSLGVNAEFKIFTSRTVDTFEIWNLSWYQEINCKREALRQTWLSLSQDIPSHPWREERW